MKYQYADPPPDADFLATRPPPIQQQDAHLAELMSSLGASTVRAVIFDLDTKLCRESWLINEYGESSNESNDGGATTHFVTAMGTIAQLSQTSANETLVRQLNPRRCAFAWRIDDHRVAVAEARYLLPQTGRRDQDAAVLRELFHACMPRQATSEAAMPSGVTPEFPEHGPATDTAAAHGPDAGGRQPRTPHLDVPVLVGGAPPRAGISVAMSTSTGTGSDTSTGTGSGTTTATGAATSTGTSAGLFALMLFCLVAAIVFLVADRQTRSLQDEQLRLQSQADATMIRQLADVLALGDYGEVQAELETFAELGYVQDAVVTNAQRRVVALVGTVQDARIGNVLPSDGASTGKVVALRARDQPGVGHLTTWAMPGSTVKPFASQRTLLIAASLLSLAALVNAAWLLVRYRRRRGLWPAALFRGSDVTNP